MSAHDPMESCSVQMNTTHSESRQRPRCLHTCWQRCNSPVRQQDNTHTAEGHRHKACSITACLPRVQSSMEMRYFMSTWPCLSPSLAGPTAFNASMCMRQLMGRRMHCASMSRWAHPQPPLHTTTIYCVHLDPPTWQGAMAPWDCTPRWPHMAPCHPGQHGPTLARSGTITLQATDTVPWGHGQAWARLSRADRDGQSKLRRQF